MTTTNMCTIINVMKLILFFHQELAHGFILFCQNVLPTCQFDFFSRPTNPFSQKSNAFRIYLKCVSCDCEMAGDLFAFDPFCLFSKKMLLITFCRKSQVTLKIFCWSLLTEDFFVSYPDCLRNVCLFDKECPSPSDNLKITSVVI